jgi:hypothetical protein
MVAFRPSSAVLPVFSVPFSSDSVLPVANRDGDSTVAPRWGWSALSKPCSSGLLTL